VYDDVDLSISYSKGFTFSSFNKTWRR